MSLFVISLLALMLRALASVPCAPRDYGYGSNICVCNSTYCDTLDPVSTPSKGEASLYESNKIGKRFSRSTMKFASSYKSGSVVVEVNRTEKNQFVVGFGGAFTDSSGINIASLPSEMQTEIMNGYFSKYGLEYTMGRVPMASCDFSTNVYSYDDVPDDVNLTHFQLAKEDLVYKIPYIKMAQSMSSHRLLLFGSPWSAPGWMKTNGKMYGQGTIKAKYYQSWAQYFVRFLQEYEKANVTFWGLTAQNEPTDGFLVDFKFQAMAFSAETQRDFVKSFLGPALAKAGFGPESIKLMIMDDNMFLLPKWADVVLSDPEAAQYVSGVAFHWYTNVITPPVLLDITHAKHPGVFLLPSEACAGSMPWELMKVVLGSWERAEKYAHDIIQDLVHWSIGWIDWNLALNMDGGPNWVKNFVDSPIIVNATAKEFYRQPMYYALAHFSKLLPPGSIRIGFNIKSKNPVPDLDIAAFETPLDTTVVIILNRRDVEVPLVLQDPSVGYLNIIVSPRSIQSYSWRYK